MKALRQISMTASVLLALSFYWQWEAKAQTKKVYIKFSELTANDTDRLNRQRQVVAAVLKDTLGISELKKDQSDLKLIQKIIDAKSFGRSQTYELQSLGVVFGDVLAGEFGLHWVMMTDEYGTDPTLRYEKSSLNINALTMISKRVERGDKLDVQRLYDQVRDSLSGLKGKADK